MKWVINIVAKLTGAKAAWDKVSGYKTYLAGTAAILTGAAGLLNGVAGLESVADVLEWAKALPQNANWVTLLGGLATVGLRHAQEKSGGV